MSNQSDTVAGEPNKTPAASGIARKMQALSVQIRAERLWRFMVVTISAWLFFCVYFCFRNISVAAVISGVEVVVGSGLMWKFRKIADQSWWILHGSLASTALGVFLLSTVCGNSLHSMVFYLPCTIIIAAQLAGSWTALNWCLVTIGLTYLHFVTNGESVNSSPEAMVTTIALPTIVFFLCHQAEYFYQKRSKDIRSLSENVREQNETMKKLATIDTLTSLPNRYLLGRILQDRCVIVDETKQTLAVMMVDLDGLKGINDTLGHNTGDRVLSMVGDRLVEAGGVSGFVARHGGDEFCLLLPNVPDRRYVERMAVEIKASIEKPFLVDGEELEITCYVGASLCPDHTTDPDQAIIFADTAMYQAKSEVNGYLLYETSMTDELIRKRELQDKLSKALERDEFRLVFQPQADMRSGNVTSVETLLRWHHNGEIVPPLDFIPMLETTGEIVNVSRWIVEQSCTQLQEWQNKGYNVRIAINISPVEFSDPDFVNAIADSIARHEIDASQLEFEITEGLLIEDVDTVIDRLDRLKQLGASISVDDFGTGYSSLSYLKQFPIDRLKIDRAFVKDLPHNDDGVIASSIIVLAQALDMKVIAEGVETVEQLEFLSAHGCDEYQGFYLSRPVSAEECERFFDPSIRLDSKKEDPIKPFEAVEE